MTDYREFQDGDLVPGTRYRVTRLVGTGGMGRVYEVEHEELGKRFVLKALLHELSRREDLVARLRNEWRALARLEHPNIVGVTDAGTSDSGVPFYVMERLEGETLSALLHRQRRLHPQHALGIAAGILQGLHAAHQIGVVHRDVKPPNIFLTTAGAVKVLDFGIAKIKDAKGVITARGIAVGTPRYMSPEQAQGAPVDARSDIYATGLMLFEMLSGVGPFDDAKDHNELLLAHLGRPAPLLSSICVVAPELDAVVAAMLAKDPRERPRSAQQVAETVLALSQRYAHFVATDAPTVNVTPRPPALGDVPTRQDGGRRSPRPGAPTRPDGPAALGRTDADPTTLRPALESATTAAQILLPSHAGGTLRLEVPAAPPSFYGPDTLVSSLTGVPTGVPGAASEQTELLVVQPLVPGGGMPTDPGPTRTAVPLPEANLTPPPVVPVSASVPPKRAPGANRTWLLFVAAGVGVGVLGGGAWLWRARAPFAAVSPLAAPEKRQVVAARPGVPAPVTSVAAAAERAEPSEPKTEPPLVAAPAPAAPSTSASVRNDKKKGVFLGAAPRLDAAPRPAAAAPVTASPKASGGAAAKIAPEKPTAAKPGGMPGSGL
ncbi:MAG: serine/threonine protein kinase [Myxococcales bacterium]|nr:MAG: serine/threonine protein kinase [Myxococcales bacterium]